MCESTQFHYTLHININCECDDDEHEDNDDIEKKMKNLGFCRCCHYSRVSYARCINKIARFRNELWKLHCTSVVRCEKIAFFIDLNGTRATSTPSKINNFSCASEVEWKKLLEINSYAETVLKKRKKKKTKNDLFAVYVVNECAAHTVTCNADVEWLKKYHFIGTSLPPGIKVNKCVILIGRSTKLFPHELFAPLENM